MYIIIANPKRDTAHVIKQKAKTEAERDKWKATFRRNGWNVQRVETVK